MVLQEIDTIQYSVKGMKHSFDYFAPNNVGILLSVGHHALIRAKKIYENYLNSSTFKFPKDKRDEFIVKSKMIYDYIEQVQTSIVFGYTALEAFCNLSIPDDFTFKSEVKSRGTIELYDKKAIERWVPLKTKICEILVNIYETKSIKSTKVCSEFNQFEELRHEIIHQKSINATGFYKKYFNEKFCGLLTTPENVIRFFFDERKNKTMTDPLWPFVINSKNEFPISHDFKSENFVVTGNIYEGRTK